MYGREYYFGGGIQSDHPGATPFGRPLQILCLGTTEVPQELYDDFLAAIAPQYTADAYDLLRHNCNNFTDAVAQFLIGEGIPRHIIDLPNEVLSSPMGPVLMPLISSLGGGLAQGRAGQPAAQPIARGAMSWAPSASLPPLRAAAPAPAAVQKPPELAAALAGSSAAALPGSIPADPDFLATAVRERAASAAEGRAAQLATQQAEPVSAFPAAVSPAPAGDAVAAQKEEFKRRVQVEFARLVADGVPASEAAQRALQRMLSSFADDNQSSAAGGGPQQQR